MENRVFNFNPGPAALPLEVLEEAQRTFIEYGGRGMSDFMTGFARKRG